MDTEPDDATQKARKALSSALDNISLEAIESTEKAVEKSGLDPRADDTRRLICEWVGEPMYDVFIEYLDTPQPA